MTETFDADGAVSAFDQLDTSVPAETVRATYAAMRERCPVAHVDRYGGFSMITRFDDVRSVAGDHRTFSSADGSFIPPSGWPPIPPLDFDEPEHRRWVKIMQPPLSLSSVSELKPMIRTVVNKQIDTFVKDGKADLYSTFAEPVPVYVTGRLVGLSPEASDEMRVVAMEMFEAIGSPQFDAKQEAFNTFTFRELAARRKRPREDYLTQLASGALNGETITDIETAGVLVALLVGGHHSTAAALAGLLHHTLSVPGLKERLIQDPSLIPAAVEESLRLTAPLQFFARTARADVVVAGTEVPASHRVIANFAAANRDERHFTDPDLFAIDRGKNTHLAFGHGIHLCIGRHLARAELLIALSEVLRRLPDICVDGQVVESGLIAGIMLSIVSLPTAFTPGAVAGQG